MIIARRSASLLLLGAAWVLWTPTPALADESVPTVESSGTRAPLPPQKRGHTGMITGGILLLAIPYGLGFTGVAGNALLGGPGRESWLLLPGFGSVVLMAETTNSVGNVVLAADTLLQLSGVAMITYGLAAPAVGESGDAAAPTVSFVPIVGSGRTGVGLVGTF